MSQPYRLASGGRIDRSAPIIMRFNGQEVPAYAGDTAASALLANGIHFVGRSFKYHRPRGIMAAGSEEANALLDEIDDRLHGSFGVVAADNNLDGFTVLRAERENAENTLRVYFLPAGLPRNLDRGVIALCDLSESSRCSSVKPVLVGDF